MSHQLRVERQPVDGLCPECGARDLARYPVVAEHGWEMVTKCQSCLLSLERERWNLLGPVSLLVDGVG